VIISERLCVVTEYDLVKREGLRGVLIWMLNGCTKTEAPEMWASLDSAFGKRQPVGKSTSNLFVIACGLYINQAQACITYFKHINILQTCLHVLRNCLRFQRMRGAAEEHVRAGESVPVV
jgi:hypothetical protein